MKTIEELAQGSLIEQIATAHVTGPIGGDEHTGHTSLRGFSAVLQRLTRTPALLRLLLHREFHFVGQVDATACQGDPAELLREDWYESTFVIPDYSKMPQWASKFSEEASAGRTVVAVIPARTNTAWFHDLIVEKADEVRFVKGRLTFPGHTSQTPFPDLLVVFHGRGNAEAAARRAAGAALASPAVDVTTTQGRQRERVSIMAGFVSGDVSLSHLHSGAEPAPRAAPCQVSEKNTP